MNCDGVNASASVDLSGLAEARAKHPREFLLGHINICIWKIRAQIMIISETKIDSSYPDSQFDVPSYSLYRNDRKKGGGGILAYISSDLNSKRMKLQRRYKTFEPTVFEIELKTKSIIVIGIYRSPSQVFTIAYQQQLEELNHICTWASLHKQNIVLLGDRLRLDKAEGKVLRDLDETQGMDSLITKPTRIQRMGSHITESLIDVILTNQPEMFIDCGLYESGLCDHALVYGFLNERCVNRRSRW